MPNYRFIIDAGDRDAEEYGVVLADDAKARAESIRLAGDVLRFETNKVVRNRLVRVKVFDASLRPLFLITVLATEANS